MNKEEKEKAKDAAWEEYRVAFYSARIGVWAHPPTVLVALADESAAWNNYQDKLAALEAEESKK